MTNNKSQLKIGVVLNYINLLIGTLIPVFYTPVMLKILGQEEYGLYKLSSSVTSYLSLISLGIGTAVTRYLIKSRTEQGKEEEEKMLGLFVLIFQVIAIVSFVVGIIITLNLDLFYGDSLTTEELSRMKIIIFLMVCSTALSFSVSPFLSVVNAHEKFIFVQSMNIILTSVIPIVNLIVLFMGFASIGMAASSLAIGLIVNILYMLYVRKSMKLKPRFKNLPLYLIKEILIFSFWIFVSNVVNQLYNATDTVLIGAIPALATKGVAVYNIGAVFNNIVFQASFGIRSVLIPHINEMVFSGASNTELTNLAIKVARIQCFIVSLIISGFIAFGKPFIHFYAGKGYGDAYWVAVFMMIPNMIPLIQSACLSIIISRNQHRFRSLVYLCIAVINVVGSWFMLKVMGIIGAAFVTGFALILGPGFAMNWYYKKKSGLEISRFWKEIAPIYIVPVIMCAVTLFISKVLNFYSIPVLLCGIIVYTIVYCIANWTVVMNQYEKSLIILPIKKITNKFKKH